MESFSRKNAYVHAVQISKLRLVGSPGEIEAREYIKCTLQSMGLEPKEELFSFYPRIQFGFLLFGIGLMLLLLILAWTLWDNYPRFIGIISLGLPFLANRMSRIHQQLEAGAESDSSSWASLIKKLYPKSGQKFESANISATLSGDEGKGSKAFILLLAHYDSKSQNISLPVRVTSAIMFALGIYFLPLLMALSSIFGSLYRADWFQTVCGILFYLAFIGGAILFSLRIGNKSPGALDNAASCGVLLELLRILNEPGRDFSNAHIDVTFTGAEELGLTGAYRIAKERLAELKERHYIVINLDGIGASTKLVMTSETGLSATHGRRHAQLHDLVRDAAHFCGLKIRRLTRNIGGEADHFPFVLQRIPAVTIGTYGAKTLGIHTKRDSIDKVDLESLEVTGELLINLIEITNQRMARNIIKLQS